MARVLFLHTGQIIYSILFIRHLSTQFSLSKNLIIIYPLQMLQVNPDMSNAYNDKCKDKPYLFSLNTDRKNVAIGNTAREQEYQ